MTWLLALSLLCCALALGWSLLLLRKIGELHRGALSRSEETAEALHSSEAHFRSLVENAIDIVAVLDELGRFVYVSPSVQRVLGYAPDELVGRVSLDFVHEDDRANVAHEFAGAMEAPGRSHGLVCRMLHKDGTLRLLQSRGGAVTAPHGKRHALLNLRDVTAQQHAEAEKQRLQAQLQGAQKMETLGSMAGGIAHDFNNLLTPILGNAELARLALPPDSAAREHVLRMSEAAHRGKSLVQRVLLLSQKAQGQLEAVAVQDAVIHVLSILEPTLPKDVQLVTELDPATARVLADPSHIQQALLNLCSNAIHAMRVRGGRLSVRVRPLAPDDPLRTRQPSFAERACTLVEVSDTGTGMDARTLEQAFEPFFSTKDGGESSGLGLSIVYGIVRSLGGAIDVQSEIDRGSRFSLLLPVHDRPLSSRPAPSSPSPRRARHGHLLLVDDDRAVLAVCRELLELLGYDVTPTGDPHEALKCFTDDPQHFDAVVTDQTMPKMTGVELARAITAIRPTIPIVITTGFAEGDVFENNHDLPIAEVVSKPYTLEDLGAAISRALDRSQRASQPDPAA